MNEINTTQRNNAIFITILSSFSELRKFSPQDPISDPSALLNDLLATATRPAHQFPVA